MVDIDKKDNGEQKERFIVKRLAAKEGEKLCVLNDKVYKKTNDSKWMPMSDIKGEKEYGNVDLYYDLNPKMRYQMITRELREILRESENLVNGSTVEEISNNLKSEKESLIANLKNVPGKKIFEDLSDVVKKHSDEFNDINNSLSEIQEPPLFALNIMKKQYKIDKSYIDELFFNYRIYLEKYHFSIYTDLIREFSEYSNKTDPIAYFNNEIKIELKIEENMNPYDQYMKKLNAVYKIYKMRIFSFIIKSYKNGDLNSLSFDKLKKSSIYADLHKFYTMSVYLEGFIFESAFNDTFSLRNFSEYPEGEGNYLSKDDFFVMGDNRYNSLDSRLGNASKIVRLDKDDYGDFTKKVVVKWKPHTVKMKHILGKAKAIYFPLDRMGFLK